MRTYKTFILEDRFFDRTAIEKILGEIPEIQVVGTASTARDALSICERKNPDLIIADAKLGQDKQAGASFVKNIRKTLPGVRILGLTYHADLIDGLTRAGCDFVVNKALIENHEAARTYIRETLIPRPEYYREFAPPALNEQQDRVLKYICEGLTEGEIAKELGFATRKPVRSIKNTLFDLFGANNIANLVHLAYKSGYLDAERD